MKILRYIALAVTIITAAVLMYFIITYETKTEYVVENGVLISCVTNVKKLTVPAIIDGNEVNTIAQYAFLNNESLNSLEFSDGLTTIEANAFSGCTALRSITLPKTTGTIAPGAFSDCPELAKIETGYDNRVFESMNGILFNKGRTKLMHFPQGYMRFDYYVASGTLVISEKAFYQATFSDVQIADSVLFIQAYAFAENPNLKKVVIPDQVENINDYAFDGCTKLEKITIGDNVVLGIGVTGDDSFLNAYTAFGAGTYVKTQDGWEKSR